jgi:hypothetical protein
MRGMLMRFLMVFMAMRMMLFMFCHFTPPYEYDLFNVSVTGLFLNVSLALKERKGHHGNGGALIEAIIVLMPHHRRRIAITSAM